jgi:hypothetical protein
MDTYVEKYIKAICKCTGTFPENSVGLKEVINKIYEDGFTDGSNEGNTDL